MSLKKAIAEDKAGQDVLRTVERAEFAAYVKKRIEELKVRTNPASERTDREGGVT